MRDSRPAVLLLAFPEGARRELNELDANLLTAADADQAAEILAERDVAALCLGPEARGETARELLETILERRPDHRGANLVLAGADLAPFADLWSPTTGSTT